MDFISSIQVLADSVKNKVGLKSRVIEGAMPLWLHGGQDINGINPKPYGTVCGFDTEEFYAGDPKCHRETDIAIAKGFEMKRHNKMLFPYIMIMAGIINLCFGDIRPGWSAGEETILGVTIRGEWGDSRTHALTVDVGARWVRTSVSWAAQEPVQGQRNLSNLDSFFKSFTDIGLKPIVFIAENPSWAASSGCGPIDKVSLQTLADFMGALAERYDGDGDYDGDGIVDGPALPNIEYWALYNEPDNQWTTGEASTFAGCWGRDGKSFAQLMGLVKQAVQRANPNAKVVLGIAGEKVSCPNTWTCAGQDIFNFNIGGGDFVDDVLGYIQSHPGEYFDVFDFHYYPAFQWQWASWGNGILGKARYYQNRLQNHGLSKPIIVTETGKKS